MHLHERRGPVNPHQRGLSRREKWRDTSYRVLSIQAKVCPIRAGLFTCADEIGRGGIRWANAIRGRMRSGKRNICKPCMRRSRRALFMTTFSAISRMSRSSASARCMQRRGRAAACAAMMMLRKCCRMRVAPGCLCLPCGLLPLVRLGGPSAVDGLPLHRPGPCRCEAAARAL